MQFSVTAFSTDSEPGKLCCAWSGWAMDCHTLLKPNDFVLAQINQYNEINCFIAVINACSFWQFLTTSSCKKGLSLRRGMGMNGNYAYTPEIWPSVFTVFLLMALAAYSWRRRSVPGAIPFAISCLLAVLLATGGLMTYLAVDPGTRLSWNKFADIWWLPAATAVTCFILEYAWPGRWLTRRNLFLLSVGPILGALYILTDSFFHLIPPSVGVQGMIGESFGQFGGILFIYSLGLALINFIVFGWLFLRSPQHRWPVILMATGQIVVRILLLSNSPRVDALLLNIPEYAFPYLTYAFALFGFRIFDPIPIARQMTVEQLPAGMLVLDPQERVTSMNPSAEQILNVPMKQARGRPVRELLPAYPVKQRGVPDGTEIEFSMGTEHTLRYYILTISMLKDFRGLEVGRLILLRDVTEQKRIQAQIMEQQNMVAALHERGQLARELHDSLGQVLGYISMQAQAIRKRARDGDIGSIESQLARLAEVAQEAHRDIRESIFNLKNGPAEEWFFFAALRGHLTGYQEHYGIRAELAITEGLTEDHFETGATLQLLRVIQEALTNTRKHGRARHVQVSFACEEGQVQIVIADDGCGFDSRQISESGESHYGLAFMRERLGLIGGSLKIETEPGAGTRVLLHVPIRQKRKEAAG
jgi:signal transduction histidine kinase